MSKNVEICSVTYNIALNQDANDVYRNGCAHLYHFLHVNGNYGKSTEYKPMTLKMHLDIKELIEETEEQIVEHRNSNNDVRKFIQQLEAKFQSLENSLQANNYDAVNKLMERTEKKLEKNLSNNFVNEATDVGSNTINYETNNALPTSSHNAPIQSTHELETKLKTLEDALQAKDDVVNKIIKRMEQLEKNLSNIIDNKLADGCNNTIDRESNNVLLNSYEDAPKQYVQQLEAKLKTSEDSPQANNVDAINKLIERMDRMFEKNLSNNIVNKTPDVGNNTIDHESNNVLLNSSDNVPTKSALQLEAKLKTLEDSLQAKDDVVNKIMERLEKKLENIVHKATDIGNNTIDHESNNTLLNISDNAARQSVQQFEKEIKDLKDRIEKLELNKAVNETIDIGNPTTHDNSTDKEQQQATKHKSSQKQSRRIHTRWPGPRRIYIRWC